MQPRADPDTRPLPVIRLKPKADLRALRAGHPWLYVDQIVTDRRTRALAPGCFAVLEDAGRSAVAQVTVNPNSKIFARIMDADPEARIDADWLRERLARALSLREQLYDAPFYRLAHAEADGLPGLILDRFGDVLVIQPNAAWAELWLPQIAEILQELTGVRAIYKNASGRARGLEGLDSDSRFLIGSVAGPIEVAMNGATYLAEIEGGQKTGLFYDQRDNHALAARLARGGRVLDMFSHVGGFGLAALASGATGALCVDSSDTALALAREGARRSGFAPRLQIRRGDGFAVMEALLAEGETFDCVIADPPAFAPSKQALEKGLRAYARVAALGARLVSPGGYLALCSCSHAADGTKFRQACLRGISKAGRRAQILATGQAGPDHPTHPALAESGYLKALFFRLI